LGFSMGFGVAPCLALAPRPEREALLATGFSTGSFGFAADLVDGFTAVVAGFFAEADARGAAFLVVGARVLEAFLAFVAIRLTPKGCSKHRAGQKPPTLESRVLDGRALR
jgi:hypothetical protein